MSATVSTGPLPEALVERLSDLLAAALIKDVRAQLEREQQQDPASPPTKAEAR